MNIHTWLIILTACLLNILLFLAVQYEVFKKSKSTNYCSNPWLPFGIIWNSHPRATHRFFWPFYKHLWKQILASHSHCCETHYSPDKHTLGGEVESKVPKQFLLFNKFLNTFHTFSYDLKPKLTEAQVCLSNLSSVRRAVKWQGQAAKVHILPSTPPCRTRENAFKATELDTRGISD